MKVSSIQTFLFIPLRFFLSVVIGWYIIPIAAQQPDYLIKSFSVEQGLAHPNVKSIVKDTSGFLWIGTFDGLSRFDGNEFVNYRHSPDDSGSIPPNNILKLCVDRKNRLWILNHGVSRLEPASEKFIIYPRTLFNPDNLKKPPWINTDPNGTIWILMTKEFLFYDDLKDEFVPIRVIGSGVLETPAKSGYVFNFDENGYLWIIGDDKVFCCNVSRRADLTPLSVSIIASYKIINQRLTPDYAVQLEHTVTQSEYGTFLFSNVGLYQLHQDKKAFIPVTGEPEKRWFIRSRSFAWLDKDKCLHAWNAKRKEITTITQSDLLLLETAYADADDSWWFSGLDQARNGIGIRHANPVTKSFHHYFQKFKGETTAVFAICREKNGSFWVGNRSKESLVHLTPGGFPDRVLPFSQFVSSKQTGVNLSMTHIRAISKDTIGNLWIGFLHSFLFYLPPTGKNFLQFFPDPAKIDFPEKTIFTRQILPLKNGNLFVGGDACMFLINPGELKIVSHFHRPVSSGMFASFQDRQGNIWIGNSSSILTKFDQNLNVLDSVRLSADFYNLECITGNNDTLWIAAMGGGLIRYITRDRSIKFYSTHNGLSNNYAYHILPDKYKNLWISTNEGLSVFNPHTEIFTNFSETDGLRIREFNADAGYRADNGELFFGGMGGFIGFFPDSVYKMQKNANRRLLITNVSVSGIRKQFNNPVYTMDTIVLGLGDNNLQLNFACLEFNFPEKINYRYRLDGVDNKWCMTKSDNRHANYAGLAPGWYRFVVEVADKTGNWSVQRGLTINLPAYMYQTIWFKLSLTILLCSLVALFLWMKLKQVRLVNLKRQETLRMQSLQAQLNPHFIFNSLNSISYLISNKPQEVADQYVADFASLMRSFLDNSSRDFILLSEEIESIEHYLALEHLRLNEKFDFRVECPAGLETEAIEVVPSLIQPFIENAIWHGVGLLKERKGTIIVRFDQISPKFITCTVEDDGIGRVKAGLLKSTDYRKRQSKGVNLILDRLKIINSLYKTDYQVLIEDLTPGAEETGTKVTIPLPVRVV